MNFNGNLYSIVYDLAVCVCVNVIHKIDRFDVIIFLMDSL
jgi:hypothetical protein